MAEEAPEEKIIKFDTSKMSDEKLAEITGGTEVTTTYICPYCKSTSFSAHLKFRPEKAYLDYERWFTCDGCGTRFESSYDDDDCPVGAIHTTAGTFD